jgi:hypothetical protein
MALSITHRFTGLAQNGFMYGLAIGKFTHQFLINDKSFMEF